MYVKNLRSLVPVLEDLPHLYECRESSDMAHSDPVEEKIAEAFSILIARHRENLSEFFFETAPSGTETGTDECRDAAQAPIQNPEDKNL